MSLDLTPQAPTRTDEERPSPLTDEERELLYGPLRRPDPAVDESAREQESAPAPRRRPVWRRALRRLSSLVMVLAIGFMLLVTLGPRFLPFQSFYIRTGSMRPGIPVGSLVVATREPAADLHVGDIIVFDRPGVPGDMVTHRIFAIEDSPSGPQFVTKGDANGVPDPWRVSASGEGWKYKFSVSYAGYAVGYLQVLLAGIGPRGALVIVCTVLALIAIWRTPQSDEENAVTEAAA